VRNRVALVLAGGFDQSDVNLADTGDLLAFEPAMSRALEQLILARKRGRGAARSAANYPAVEPSAQASLIPKRNPPRSRERGGVAVALGAENAQTTAGTVPGVSRGGQRR
jgi:hypothetical protein